MFEDPDTKYLLVGTVVGLVIGSLVGGVFVAGTGASSPDSTPSMTVGSSGPSCYDGPQENAGWLHIMAAGKTWSATLNATVIHPPGTELEVNVSGHPTGTHEIALETNDTSSESSLSENDCRVATTINVATALEQPDMVVTINGRTVRSVDQDETVANLYPLPNPINASA